MATRSESTAARLGRTAATLIRGPRSRRQPPAAGNVARALERGGRHLLGRIGGVFAHIGLQISAILYLALALSFGAAGITGWRTFHHGAGRHSASLTQAPPMTQLELALALVFLYFALSSLLRVGRHS